MSRNLNAGVSPEREGGCTRSHRFPVTGKATSSVPDGQPSVRGKELTLALHTFVEYGSLIFFFGGGELYGYGP